MEPWTDIVLLAEGFETREKAWEAYLSWVTAVFRIHSDAELQCTVKLFKHGNRWTIDAKVSPCSKA
jgi:hypothetical protein